MMVFKLITYIFLIIDSALCGILIISPNKLDMSTMKPFDSNTFELLKNNFKKAKLFSYNINSEFIPNDCELLLKNKYTTYLTNVEYIPDDIQDVDYNEEMTCDFLKDNLTPKNIYLIIHKNRIAKRSVTDSPIDDTTTEDTTYTSKERNNGRERNISKNTSVLYNGKTIMVYSSQLLHFQYLNITEYYLGSATLVTTNIRDTVNKLSCTIALDDGKIIIIFVFRWDNGYWILNTVEIWDTKGGNSTLTTTSPISAPRGFSYRCGGETVFTNGNYTLTLYDMQAQPLTEVARFSEAYNCVPFITGPIWSGIFVTSILCVGMLTGLIALGSIKTMDKFDNSKTKQLTITVIDEAELIKK